MFHSKTQIPVNNKGILRIVTIHFPLIQELQAVLRLT